MDKSERQNKNDGEACFSRALRDHQAGHLEAAKTAYEEILAQDPDHLLATINLATVFAQCGQLEAALPFYDRAITLRPGHLDAYKNKALCLKKLGRPEEALACYEQALQLAKDDPGLLNNKGALLQDLERYDEALACFEEALVLDPAFIGAELNRGSLFRVRGQFDAALESFEKIRKVSPQTADEMIGKAIAEQQMGRREDALATCRAALALQPMNGAVQANLGSILKDLGRYEEAMAVYDRALAQDPENILARCNRAILMLSLGQFTEGWKEHEWRLRKKGAPKQPPDIPRWQGEPLKGKRLYVEAEQGIGDAIQFLRYLEPLKKAGATIIFGAGRPLLPLARLVTGMGEIVTYGDPVPKADYYCPLLSLPHALKDAPPGTVPCTVPYMASEAGLVEKWREKLPKNGAFRVGIAWQGNPAYYYDYLRSIPLKYFAPLMATEGVQFFSLQKGFGAEQLKGCGFGGQLVDFGAALDAEAGPFMDTAAILAHMDLIIASDSAVAHLAGAMGMPVWMLISTHADWRWGLEGEKSCWYPSMRLCRQSESGDWQELMARVQGALISFPKNRLEKSGARAPMDKNERRAKVESEACFRRAVQDHKDGRLKAAKTAYEEILAHEPDHAGAIGNLAAIYAEAGQLADALSQYERVIALQPDHPDAHNNKGLILEKLGRLEEALTCFDEALRLKSDNWEVLNNKGAVLQGLERYKEALACFDQALALDPAFVSAGVNRAGLLRHMGQFEASLSSFEKILKTFPRDVGALTGRALAELRLGRNEDALATCRAALALEPMNGEVQANMGSILKDLGRFDEAMSVYDRAIALDPENILARSKRAILLLSLGQFRRGWKEYEWRLREKGAPKQPPDIPRWLGEPLAGKRIYVKAEQGVGDAIQFLRYIEPLKKAGATIILGVAKEVLPLARLVSGIDEFITQDPPAPRADYYCPLLSLPHVLEDAPPGTVPCTVPYMAPEAGLVEKWREKLPKNGGLRVGIAWQGNPSYYYDYLRSIPLKYFAPLMATKGVQFFSLQKGFGGEQLKGCGFGGQLVDFGAALDAEAGPFMDTAAILAHMDLVVASDSAVAHLAGAMGVPVWMLTPTPADWRWGMVGEKSCWYPSMRLCRQSESGDWQELMARVQKELVALAENHRQ